MNSRKLKQTTREESAQENQLASGQKQTREFKSAEEMLRHDSEHTVVPPEIAVRLRDSMARETPRRNWWRRLLGG